MNVYNRLTKEHIKEVEIVMEKLAPMFVSQSEDECFNLATKMMKFRKMLR